jgi:AcrR family transcriptional regulator
MKDTKTLILDAAERLVAERGFASSSLRAITAAAGVNLGAINYHFRSKEALIQAIFARRLTSLNRERLAALDACEAAAGGGPVAIEELLRAFLAPVLHLGPDGEGFMRLMGRMYSEPLLDIQRIFAAELGEVVRRFTHAFHRSLPRLPSDELFWRLFFTIGALAQTLAAGTLLEFLSGGRCDPSDLEEAQVRLIRFAGAGLNAPAAGKQKRTEGRRRSS